MFGLFKRLKRAEKEVKLLSRECSDLRSDISMLQTRVARRNRVDLLQSMIEDHSGMTLEDFLHIRELKESGYKAVKYK